MSEILNNIYIDRFLFAVFLKYISSQTCSHVFGNVLLDTFWRLWKLVSWRKMFLKLSYIYPKTSNFHNSGMVSRRKLPNLSLNNIFSVLSIGFQCTLSFKRPEFGLKCRVAIIPKGQSLTRISLRGEVGAKRSPGMFCFITF